MNRRFIQLLNRINQLPPPTKPATSRDVARLANVSQSTVSRVLQGSTYVEPGTRDAVMKAIAKLGYLPSAAARSMRTRRSNTIALVVASLTVNPLFPTLLQLLSAELRQYGLQAIVWEAESIGEDTARQLIESAIDGVIVTTAVDAATPFLSQVAQRKPVVLVNRAISGSVFDQISSDNLEGGRTVADYFCDQGKRRIGLLSAKQHQASTIQDRERGFKDGLLRRGIKLASKDIVRMKNLSYSTGYEAANTLLQSGDYDAIFCVNDIAAIGALDAIRKHHSSTDKSPWLVGYDDIPMSAWECISLSTVRQPLEEMVGQAVQMLRTRLDGSAPSTPQVLLKNKIVHRQSTLS